MARQVPNRVIVTGAERLADPILLSVRVLVEHGAEIGNLVMVLERAIIVVEVGPALLTVRARHRGRPVKVRRGLVRRVDS